MIVHLNGDSSNLENAINSARKSISDLQRSGNRIDDIQKSFDKVTNSTMPLRRRIAEIKKAMEAMAVEGLDATEEGKEMWQKLSEAAQQYDEMLRKIQNDTRKVSQESSNVSPISSEGGKFDLKNVDFKSVGTDLLGKSGLGNVAPALGAIAGAINPVTVGLTAVGGTMIAAGKATAEFETHLNSLQALTGLTDNEMKAINDGAIEMSKGFKSSASEIVDAMKLIGSQAPELLKDSDALMEVTKAANVLSEAAEIGVEDAAKAITGTMNQMGASASEATNIINTFAAASQQGSADVAYLNKAFEKSGTAASSAGMDYVQLASAIEAIAPKFSSADVAGSQLASTLLKLSMSGNSDFMPSVVGMSKALENLANAEMDDVTMKNLVGESNITMLKSLIQARDQFDSYSESLKGTNTAFEQMETNQKGFTGAINKMKSAWDAFLLTLGQSGIMEGITDNIIAVVNAVNEIINVVSDVIKSFESFGETGVENINLFKIQLDFLINIIKGVGEIIEVVIRIIAKAFNSIVDAVNNVTGQINDKWQGVKKQLMDIGFVRAIINAFNKVIEGAVNMCNAIKKYWNKLKEFLGMKVEANIEDKPTKTDANITTDKPTTITNNSTTSTNKSGKTKSSKGSKSEKTDYIRSVDDNSLDVAEKKLQAWNNKLKLTPTTDEKAIKECQEEIEKWKKEVENRKLKIQADDFEKGSIADIENQIKHLEEAKKELLKSVVDPTQIKELEIKAKELKNQLEKEQIRIGLKPEIEDGSLNAIKKKIKEKEEEIALALNSNISPESMKKMQSELEALRKEEEAKEIEIGVKYNVPTIKKDNEKWERGSVEDKKQSLSNAKSEVKDIQQNFRLGLIGKEEAIQGIKLINSQLQELGLKPIEIDFDTDKLLDAQEKLETFKSEMGAVSDVTSSVGSVFGSLGSAIGGSTGEIMNFAGQSLNAISQIIPQIVALIGAKQAEAIAGGTASAAAMPFPANIAAIASIVATIASVFASLPKFESGGIVGGSSFTGDKLLARVNSGEMILNKNQQQNLYNQLDNAGIGQPTNTNVNVSGQFRVSGSDLKAVLRNYDNKINKIK